MTKKILFSRQKGICPELSNFEMSSPRLRFDVGFEPIYLPSVEHFYQAMKTLNYFDRMAIYNASTPKEARRRGREVALRPEWEWIKDRIMREGLLAKFAVPEYREILLSTGDAELIEDAPWDSYWGNGPDGKGQNKLGKMLMELRDELKKES